MGNSRRARWPPASRPISTKSSGSPGESLYFENVSESASNGAVASLFNFTTDVPRTTKPAALSASFYPGPFTTATLSETGTYLLAVAGQHAGQPLGEL